MLSGLETTGNQAGTCAGWGKEEDVVVVVVE